MNGNGIFEAGAARADITPPIGTHLYGYRPNVVSTSIHDPLNVTALALRQGDLTAIMITATVCSIENSLVEQLRQTISDVLHIPYAHILISSIHTHSGPNIGGSSGWGEMDMPYFSSIFFPGVLKAAQEAFSALVPAELAIGTTECLVGVNRRQQTPDGHIVLGQNPSAPFDPTMTVISLRNSQTKAGILNMVHYGCHGTACGCNFEITRDWSGIMTDRLEQETGTMTAYWNGAEGDVGPRLTNGKTTGNIHHVEELGSVAAFDIMKAYRAKGGYHPGQLEIFTDAIRIPHKDLPSRESIQAKLDTYQDPDALINLEQALYQYYKKTAKFLDSGKEMPTHFTLPQTLLSLGDVLFIPSPFELFSEISLNLREFSPYPYTLNLSLTNGKEGYLPTKSQIPLGGYETTYFLYGHTFPMTEDADRYFVTENLRLMNQSQF